MGTKKKLTYKAAMRINRTRALLYLSFTKERLAHLKQMCYLPPGQWGVQDGCPSLPLDIRVHFKCFLAVISQWCCLLIWGTIAYCPNVFTINNYQERYVQDDTHFIKFVFNTLKPFFWVTKMMFYLLKREKEVFPFFFLVVVLSLFSLTGLQNRCPKYIKIEWQKMF